MVNWPAGIKTSRMPAEFTKVCTGAAGTRRSACEKRQRRLLLVGGRLASAHLQLGRLCPQPQTVATRTNQEQRPHPSLLKKARLRLERMLIAIASHTGSLPDRHPQ